MDNDLICSPNTVRNVEVVKKPTGTSFGYHSERLKTIFAATYDDERKERPLEFQHLELVNECRLLLICQFLIWKDLFEHFTILCLCMTVDLSGTG